MYCYRRGMSQNHKSQKVGDKFTPWRAFLKNFTNISESQSINHQTSLSYIDFVGMQKDFLQNVPDGKATPCWFVGREKVQSGKLAGVKFKTKIQFFVNILRRIFWNILRILNKYLESKCAIREVGGIKIEEEGPSLIWRTCSQQWLHGWILRWQSMMKTITCIIRAMITWVNIKMKINDENHHLHYPSDDYMGEY